MVDTIPSEVVMAAIIISNCLSCCTLGLGASLGTYPPECTCAINISLNNQIHLELKNQYL